MLAGATDTYIDSGLGQHNGTQHSALMRAYNHRLHIHG